MDFSDVGYLKTGSPSQRNAFEVLSEGRILERLSNFEPVLIGTFPLGIDIASSDLDVACHFENKFVFLSELQSEFCGFEQFRLREFELGGCETIVCNFRFRDLDLEIFGQPIPVKLQMGYRHMVVEHKILSEKGEQFKNAIIGLKKSGLKTEPAFAKLLGIEGDPYLELLKLE